MSCDQVLESGAYVLGVLDPDDRAAYERHLETCASCQREVADFAGLPDLLARLGPAAERRLEAPVPLPSVPRADPSGPFSPHGSSLQERGGKRRQRRWPAVTVGLAAVACLAVGVLAGAWLVNPAPAPRPPLAMAPMRPLAPSVPITAQVALTPFSGGTQVRMHCVYNGGRPGSRWALKMLVYPKSGDEPEQVSTWTAAYGDDATLSAATRFAPADIGKVEIRKADNTPLLVYEQA